MDSAVSGGSGAAAIVDRASGDGVAEAHRAAREMLVRAMDADGESAESESADGDGGGETDEELREIVRERLPEFGRSGVLPQWRGGSGGGSGADGGLSSGSGAQTAAESGASGAAASLVRRGRRAAKQLARRLVRRVVNRVQEEVNEEEGLGWHGKRWVSMHDDRVRSSHKHLDGQRVAIGSAFMTQSGPIRYPGDPLAPFGETINCRCHLELLRT